MKKHKHHIIPRHMGGTDDLSNIIELTVEEHAEAHRLLYEEYGKKEDYVAWKGLEGRISSEEFIQARASIGGITSRDKRRQKGIPPFFRIADNETLFAWASKGGSVSTNAGSIWWSNGKDYKFCVEQPEGYVKSSAPNNPGKVIGKTYWWNDGVKHKRSVECPGDGWIKGRINTKNNLGGARRKKITND